MSLMKILGHTCFLTSFAYGCKNIEITQFANENRLAGSEPTDDVTMIFGVSQLIAFEDTNTFELN